MNITENVQDFWWNEIQLGNVGAALFIITYIGFYGLLIIYFFGQQMDIIQRQRYELPVYFLQTLWDASDKSKLYQELADLDRLKGMFRTYFADQQTEVNDDLQAIIDERAQACAIRYREKLRRLHLSNTDYNLDTIERRIPDDRHSILPQRRIDYLEDDAHAV